MKKRKNVFKIIITTALFALMLCLATFSIVANEAVSDSSGLIPVPAIPTITKPYETIEGFDIDMAGIAALFPSELEVSYNDGIVKVKDFGAGYVVYSNDIYYDMELIDGYWSAYIGDSHDSQNYSIHCYYKEQDWMGVNWEVNYFNEKSDGYIILTDCINDVYFTFSRNYGYVSVQYTVDNLKIQDIYRRGFGHSHDR